MKHFIATAVMASFLFFGSNALVASPPVTQRENSPEQPDDTFKYSADNRIATEQKDVHDAIIKYQNALNIGDAKTILGLFADKSHSQWSGKLTADNTEKHQGQYDDLFRREKPETDFAFDSIQINGDTAVVCTHHHVGSVITNFKEQKTITDLNCKVLVPSKINSGWKIFLYTFSTSPFQGVT